MSPPKYPIFIQELFRGAYITVGIAIPVVHVGLIVHLSHLDGGGLILIKVRFNFYPFDTQ